jgi:hypothetical protein
MARVQVATHVEASPEEVWDLLVQWERQPEWMVDARAVTVQGTRRDGEGVRLACRTDIAFGLELDDILVVTGWQPPASLAVSHEGPVMRGAGAFELHRTDAGTHLVWWEEFSTPLGAVGDAAATVLLVPWVRRIFRRSVANLKRLAERSSPRR